MMSEYEQENEVMSFTPQMRMADLIQADYRLIPIIGHFEIDYGFANKTIQEVCDNYDINVFFFLEIINSFHNPKYFPSKELQNFNTSLILKYLSDTHRFYLGKKIPEIEEYINEMERHLTKEGSRNVNLISGFFNSFKEQFEAHLKTEENVIFPYIMALEVAAEKGACEDELFAAIETNSIVKFESHHNHLQLDISDLKNLIIRHLPPVLCRELCQKLLVEIFSLEEDLGKHTRIEEKVLQPKVKYLEQLILERSGRNKK